jgi:cytochrome P450
MEAINKPVPKLSFLQVLKSRYHKFDLLMKSPSKYPDVFSFRVPGRKVMVINNHEMVQHILVRNMRNYQKDHGYKILALVLGNGLVTNLDHNSWRKQRTLLQPPFHRESLHGMCQNVTTSVVSLLKKWKAKEGQEINFSHDMAWLTIDIVCKTLFSAEVSDDDIKMVWRNLNFLNQGAIDMINNPMHIPWRFPLPRYIKGRKYIAQFDELIYGIINKRKQQKNPPRDLLQLLMEARYEDNGEGMSDLQIRDEIMTVFLAGHETTVNALSWTWYLLKKHPESEQKLYNESSPFAETPPGFYDLPTLQYGSYVMNEAMRIYPAVPAIGRAAIEDEVVNGYLIEADTITILNISGLHHHPSHWQNPYEYNPARFRDLDLKGENRFKFMPFGGGPHICIGNNFAMMEMQLINAMLSSRVEMELVSHTITPEPLITLKPGDGVIMKLIKVKA